MFAAPKASIAALVTLVTTATPLLSAPTPALKVQIDWPAFLARHDLLYSRLPEKWGEGAFTGNGLLGANVYLSEDKAALRFRIGRSDVMVQGVPQPHRLPIGDLLLKPVGKITGGTMRLSLHDATATGTLTTDRGSIAFKTFTHAAKLVQIITLEPTEGEAKATFTFEPGLAVNPRVARDASTTRPIPEDAKNPPPIVTGTSVVQPLKDGSEFATAWAETKSGSIRTLALSVGFTPSKGALAEAHSAVTSALSTGIPALEASHKQWWHSFYPASFLSIPDTRLESFYWLQLYKLASATRADRPAVDLMGPWYNDTPWPRIWWNLNIQLTYFPVYAANHLELGESLCKMIDAGKENLAKNAGEFAEDSETVSRTTGYDCRGNGGAELCNVPWTLHNYYLQYRYSMDDAMLRDRLFPRLKRSMNYYYHFLEEGPDKKLHLTRGLSPEYPKQPSPNPDCNIDLALVRWLCQTLLDSSQRLGLSDPLEAKWKDTLARLVDYPADENGLRISAATPYAESHRHYSHLLMIYPLYTMNWDQPENRELISKSFDHWLSKPAAFRGYSYTGAASIAAAILRNNDTVKFLNFFVDAKGRFGLLPNTHYTEAGPVIETPLSGARTIQDMTLTSWGNTIRVFPGYPDAWKEAAFHNLRTEGSFLVSAARKNGSTEWVHLTSEAGEPCRVKTDIKNPTATVPFKVLADNILELTLAKGGTAMIYSADLRNPPSPAVAPVAAEPGRANTFGLPN